MKAIRLFLAVFVLGGCLCNSACGQDMAATRDADHQALRQLRAMVIKGINNQDAKALASCFTKEFVLTVVDQAVITNEASLVNYYNRMFKDPKGPIAKMETAAEADILTRFIAANAGYCYGSAVDTYTLKDGRVIKIKNRWTALLQKEDGEWKASAVHIGVNFLDNPVLEARSMSIWRKLGILLHLSKPPSD